MTVDTLVRDAALNALAGGVSTGAGHQLPKDDPMLADRTLVDQTVITALLRLNRELSSLVA